jgi:hypothetical protein
MPTPAYVCSANVRVRSTIRGRSTLWKHRVMPDDTERRAPSTLQTGWLNKGVLRDLRALGVRPFEGRQSRLPLLRVRLQPFRRGREIGPLGKVPPPWHPAPASRRVGALKQDQVPNPPALSWVLVRGRGVPRVRLVETMTSCGLARGRFRFSLPRWREPNPPLGSAEAGAITNPSSSQSSTEEGYRCAVSCRSSDSSRHPSSSPTR